MWLLLIIILFVLLSIILFLRIRASWNNEYENVKTLVVLGSGGHTSEMLKLLGEMDLEFYTPRTYVIAESDHHSSEKAHIFESQKTGTTIVQIERFQRSREVGQSYFTSFFTTCLAFPKSIHILWKQKPQLVLVNGPGTCIPICVTLRLMNLLGLFETKLVFIESIARVRTLSLSGKLLYYLHMTNLFLVQWPELTQKYPQTEFRSRLY